MERGIRKRKIGACRRQEGVIDRVIQGGKKSMGRAGATQAGICWGNGPKCGNFDQCGACNRGSVIHDFITTLGPGVACGQRKIGCSYGKQICQREAELRPERAGTGRRRVETMNAEATESEAHRSAVVH